MQLLSLFFYANERTLFVYIIHLLWKKMTRKNQRVMAGEHQLLFPPFYIESRRLAIDPGHGLSVLPTMMTTRLVASIKAICVRPLTVESTSRRHLPTLNHVRSIALQMTAPPLFAGRQTAHRI